MNENNNFRERTTTRTLLFKNQQQKKPAEKKKIFLSIKNMVWLRFYVLSLFLFLTSLKFSPGCLSFLIRSRRLVSFKCFFFVSFFFVLFIFFSTLFRTLRFLSTVKSVSECVSFSRLILFTLWIRSVFYHRRSREFFGLAENN